MSGPYEEPAFPSVPASGNWVVAQPGMSLRDYFAGQALAGIAAGRMNAEGVRRYMQGKHDGREAVAAYAMADAMLQAREAKP
jgi:hypothetical protein